MLRATGQFTAAVSEQDSGERRPDAELPQNPPPATRQSPPTRSVGAAGRPIPAAHCGRRSPNHPAARAGYPVQPGCARSARLTTARGPRRMERRGPRHLAAAD